MNYLLWIPITIGYNFLACWIATKYDQRDFLRMYFWMSLIGLIPTWSLAAYLSKNLIIDALIFDTTLILSSIIFFWVMGKGENLSILNWIGIFCVVSGLVMAKW